MTGYEPDGPVQGIRRAAFVAAAMLFLGVGMVGIALPGLPTTPFLILMSYFLVRSSPTLHERVIRIPVVGQPIREWRETRGVRPQVKQLAYVMVGAMLIVSLASESTIPAVKVLIALLAACGVWVVWRLPTVPR